MAKYNEIGWQLVDINPTITEKGDPAIGIEITATVDGITSVFQVKEIGDGLYQLELSTKEVPLSSATIELVYSTTTWGITIDPETISLKDPASLSTEPQYCTVSQLYQRFGADNINKWADLNNERDTDEITNNIIDAIVTTSADMTDQFRDKRYQVPFADPIPYSIMQATRLQAGYNLSTARGMVEDDDTALQNAEKEAQTTVKRIHAGQIRLDFQMAKTFED